MPALRILVLHLTPFPSSRAPAIQVANMAQAFAALGHDVLLVSPTPGPARSVGLDDLLGFAPGFRTTTLSRRTRRGQSLRHAVRIARLVRRERPDLILSRDLRGCLLPALRGTPTLFEAHTLTTLRRPLDRWVLRRLVRARGFRGIVAISGALAEDLVTEGHVDPTGVVVLHDGVRAAAVSDTTDPAPTREDGRPFLVTYTGSLYPGKGADLLLDVARRCPWATFTIAGGPDASADALRARATEDGLTNVEVLGLLEPAAASALQRASDALIAPFSARVESDSGVDIARWTSPLKVFEYMASGRPTIVGDLPVLREVLRPDVDALLVPLEDVDAFAAAIRRLADDPALAHRLAANARDRVLAGHTWEERARAIVGRAARPVRSVSILLASLASGGAERVAITLAQGLVHAGLEARLVVADGRGPLRAQVAPGVTVVDLGAPQVRRAVLGMLRDLRRTRPDVVVVTQTHVSLAVLAALRLLPTRALRPRPRLIVREPLLRTGASASVGQERWQRRLFPTADLLVASSPAMETRLRTLTGGRVPVLELANPVDVGGLRDAAGLRGPGVADAPGGAGSPVRLVTVGRLVPQKAHDDLLRALAASGREDLRLTMVGDGPLRAELEILAGRLGLSTRVRFAGRVDDRAALLAEVAAADLLVQPSRVEGMPNAVLEALAVGTRVLATTDLIVLEGLAEEVAAGGLRLVPRDALADALATVAASEGPVPRPNLLPERFAVGAVVAALLDAVGHIGADAR